MPYTVKDIVTAFHANLAEGTSTETLATLATWTNEAQDAIAREYGHVTSVLFPGAKESVEIALPQDYLVTATVKRSGQNEPYLRYAITEYGYIVFEESGDYEVFYHKVPNPIALDDEDVVPEVHHSFHSIMHLYLLHKFYSKEPESGFGETRLAEVYRVRFYEALLVAVKNLRARARPSRKIRKV